MTGTNVEKWFQEMKRIWLEKDISALRGILADDFKYYEDPFEPAITNWEELETAWQEVNNQEIQNLEIVTLIDGESQGSARYEFSYIDHQGVKYESRGAYYLKLNQDGKATEFRQWWTVK